MTGKQGAFRAYRAVLGAPGVPVWLAVLVGQRAPVAMAPLALVYLGEAATGSYATGALLVGAHAIAEAVGAGWLGRRFDRHPVRAEAALVLGVEAAALLMLSVLASAAPVWVLLVLAAVAGAVPAGAHGGLRAVLVHTIPPSSSQAALSLEASVSTLVWAAAPAAAAGLAILGGTWPTLVMAAAAGSAALAARWLHQPAGTASIGHTTAGWLRAWPAFAQHGAAMLAVGAASIALPALLAGHGTSPGLAGPILTGFAASGLAAGLAYGARAWPGAPRLQATTLLASLALTLAAVALVRNPAAVVSLFILAGAIQTPALTARAVALQRLLPHTHWATGFSVSYAAAGLGYGGAGVLVAPLLESAGPAVAVAVGTLAAALVIVGAGVAESRAARRNAQRPAARHR